MQNAEIQLKWVRGGIQLESAKTVKYSTIQCTRGIHSGSQLVLFTINAEEDTNYSYTGRGTGSLQEDITRGCIKSPEYPK